MDRHRSLRAVIFPELSGSPLAVSMQSTGAAGAILRRLRGDVREGIAGQGSAAADRAGNATARTATASREDAHGGSSAG